MLVVIIAGGDTPEAAASLASGHHVFTELRSRFRCVLVELCHGEWSVLEHDAAALLGSAPRIDPALRFLDATTGQWVKPDVAVLCTHGYPGETGELQGLLTISGVPYCSSGVLASALAADKFRCSQYLAAVCGTTVPRQRRLTSAELGALSAGAPDLSPPLVLKPVSLGSAIGVVSVHDRQNLPAALAEAAQRRCDYVVEEFIDGLELTVGAVRMRSGTILLPPASVSRPDFATETAIRSFSDHKSVQLDIPADIPDAVMSRVGAEMVRIGDALDLIGCYRADFIVSAGELYFLEVNTIPGLSANSVFTRLAEAGGHRLGELLEPLIMDCSREPSKHRGAGNGDQGPR